MRLLIVTAILIGLLFAYESTKPLPRCIDHDFEEMILFKKVAEKIGNLKINPSSLEKIERVDSRLGEKERKLIEGFIQLNKIIAHILKSDLKEYGFENHKKWQLRQNITSLIDLYIVKITDSQLHLKDASAYLMFMESFKQLVMIEYRLYRKYQLHNRHLRELAHNDITELLDNSYSFLKGQSIDKLLNAYHHQMTKLFERQIQRVIDDEGSYLRSFDPKSFYLKTMFSTIARNNQHGIFNDLLAKIKRSISIKEDNEGYKILEGLSDSHKEQSKSYEVAPGIMIFEN